MDRSRALYTLPEAYANALRLRERGFDPAAIAAQLDIPAESVEPLLSLAEAKLERILCGGRPGGDGKRAGGEADRPEVDRVEGRN